MPAFPLDWNLSETVTHFYLFTNLFPVPSAVPEHNLPTCLLEVDYVFSHLTLNPVR